MLYARWPKSVWYVYDVRGVLHVMSLNHTEDAPVMIAHETAADVDMEFVSECFPGSSEDALTELLGYVAAFAGTAAETEEPEVPAPVASPEVVEKPKRTRKPKVAITPSADAVAADARLVTADTMLVIEVGSGDGVTANANRDVLPAISVADVLQQPVYTQHVDAPARTLPDLPELPADTVPINIDLMPDW